MVRLTDVAQTIDEELGAYLDKPVFPAEIDQNRPPKPHVTFRITTVVKKSAHPNLTIIEENGTVVEQYETQPKLTVSITAYDEDSIYGAQLLAEQCQQWFDFIGRDLLADRNMIVVDTTDIQNRDIVLDDVEYERRAGFDVFIRVTDILTKEIDGEIDTVNFN